MTATALFDVAPAVILAPGALVVLVVAGFVWCARHGEELDPYDDRGYSDSERLRARAQLVREDLGAIGEAAETVVWSWRGRRVVLPPEFWPADGLGR
jgi:hypothetical protein